MQTTEQTVCVLHHVFIIRLHPVCVKAWARTGKLSAYMYLIEWVGTDTWAYFEFTVLCIHWLSFTVWKVSKYGVFSSPQGYNQKRKLFRTKVFHTVVSHDFNMMSFSPCCHNCLACICFCACICLLSRTFCLACYRHVIKFFLVRIFLYSDWIRGFMEICVNLRIQSKYRKIRTRKNFVFRTTVVIFNNIHHSRQFHIHFNPGNVFFRNENMTSWFSLFFLSLSLSLSLWLWRFRTSLIIT